MTDCAQLVGHQVRMEWRGSEICTLADLVPDRPKALFVGINPSCVSVEAGHYYQGNRGKQFWFYIVDSGLISNPGPGAFHDDLMVRAGLGLVDLVKKPSRSPSDLEKADYEYGRALLRQTIDGCRPRVICSVFRSALEELFQQRLRVHGLAVGFEPFGCKVFVVPFPPGRGVNGDLIRQRLRELRELLDD